MEVALLYRAPFEVEFAMERRRQAVHDRPFHLGPHDVRVDGEAAVHGAEHAVHANGAIFHGYLGHLGHGGGEGVMRREAQVPPRRRGPTLPGFLGLGHHGGEAWVVV